jgi:hypothetical protein
VYGKTQAESKANTQRQWGEEGTELVHLLELGCLATHISYMSRVSTCLCQGWCPSHHTSPSQSLLFTKRAYSRENFEYQEKILSLMDKSIETAGGENEDDTRNL